MFFLSFFVVKGIIACICTKQSVRGGSETEKNGNTHTWPVGGNMVYNTTSELEGGKLYFIMILGHFWLNHM